ncbi:RbsD/FucU family protein [Halalkalibacter kiskunsagensis]|uniref:RbsD/FucU family protein n=1 Tax=Halalkalibacter kiskunsagensis TaxID=1548599 RepID=A0ABV6KCF3_9BACI
MLKGIPSILSPELMKIMLEMGHGDELVIADGNFPAASCAKRLVRSDGHGAVELLEAILPFFPIDTYVEKPISLMEVVPGDSTTPVIWDEYKQIIKKNEPAFEEFQMIERFDFYERAKGAYAIVATSEQALYANIIFKKGVVSR